ncbi:MAG: hypothetical protein ACTSXW_05720 [Candidatus Baldrarchaeia archaeon]
MAEAGSDLKNYLLYLLFKTMKKIGLSPELLFRQASSAIAEDIKYVSNSFFKGGDINTSDFKTMVGNILATLKDSNIISGYSVEFKGDNVIEILCENCCYLSMAEEAKRFGEKGCPICIVAFAGSIACATIAGYTFNKVDYEVYEPGKCRLNFEYEHV